MNRYLKSIIFICMIDVISTAAVLQNIDTLTTAIQKIKDASNLVLTDKQKPASQIGDTSNDNVEKIATELQPKEKGDVSTSYKSIFYTTGSILTLVSTILVPVVACYKSESCQKFMKENVFTFGDRRKRDLEYAETVIVALLDSFVEQDMRQDKGENIQEMGRPLYNDPLLISLSKYFDKYADQELKKHVKTVVFFLVHILGKIFGVFQSIVQLLSSYGIF